MLVRCHVCLPGDMPAATAPFPDPTLHSAIQGKGRELQLVTFKPGRLTAPGIDQPSTPVQEEHFVLVRPDEQLSEALASKVSLCPRCASRVQLYACPGRARHAGE